MGIVNTNAGSFSDASLPGNHEDLLRKALDLVDAGADLIDVGFDSGVTHSQSVPIKEQIQAGLPLVRALAQRGVPVSVDTTKPEVAQAALDVGACLINDVSGLADPRLADLASRYSAALCLMHTRAPHKVEHFPEYADVVDDVVDHLEALVAEALRHGLDQQQLVLDPGLDYAKRPHETVRVIRQCDRLEHLDRPYLFGVSRKYFAGIITGAPPPDRLPETLATVGFLRSLPCIMRVHDVAEVHRYLQVYRILDGVDSFPAYDQSDDSLKWVSG